MIYSILDNILISIIYTIHFSLKKIIQLFAFIALTHRVAKWYLQYAQFQLFWKPASTLVLCSFYVVNIHWLLCKKRLSLFCLLFYILFERLRWLNLNNIWKYTFPKEKGIKIRCYSLDPLWKIIIEAEGVDGEHFLNWKFFLH